jgi:hydrogenase-4 component B
MNPLSVFTAALAVFFLGSLATLLLQRFHGLVGWIGKVTSITGGTMFVWAGARVLSGNLGMVSDPSAGLLPLASWHLHLDALSGFFLIPLGLLGAVGGLYAIGYFHGQLDPRRLCGHLAWYHLLVGSLGLVFGAGHAVLFLIAWELMTLAAFLLILREDEVGHHRHAAWVFLVASQFGTSFLFLFFIHHGMQAGSFLLPFWPRFAGIIHQWWVYPAVLIGFGLKMGLLPFHGWLPRAHPEAPSHVSALMSGLMTKAGLYGILRSMQWLGLFPETWGWVLVGLGLVGALYGVLQAAMQAELKRALAFSTVENLSLIAFALGWTIVARRNALDFAAILAMTGLLLHVWHHALVKGLLFLGAGAVIHASGTPDLNLMGGLGHRHPLLGRVMVLGGAAAAGLPPLSGFYGEFLWYWALWLGVTAAGTKLVGPSVAAISLLCLIGGLAALAFVRLSALPFFGEPRMLAHHHKSHADTYMRWAVGILVVIEGLMVVSVPFLVPRCGDVLGSITGLSAFQITEGLARIREALLAVLGFGAGTLLIGFLLWSWVRLVQRGRPRTIGPTWDCGYAAPDSRMQYTVSSFSQPLLEVFSPILHPIRHLPRLDRFFPTLASFRLALPDALDHGLIGPVVRGLTTVLGRLRIIQEGHIQLYILYIALTLVLLLTVNLW